MMGKSMCEVETATADSAFNVDLDETIVCQFQNYMYVKLTLDDPYIVATPKLST